VAQICAGQHRNHKNRRSRPAASAELQENKSGGVVGWGILNFIVCEHKISTGKKFKTKRLWSKKIGKSEETTKTNTVLTNICDGI
jgi:hypothetical protein